MQGNLHIDPMRSRRKSGRISKQKREYLPKQSLYVCTPPLVETKKPTPKRKKISLSRQFAENLVAGLGFASGVFIFATIVVWLISGRY